MPFLVLPDVGVSDVASVLLLLLAAMVLVLWAAVPAVPPADDEPDLVLAVVGPKQKHVQRPNRPIQQPLISRVFTTHSYMLQ